VVAAPIEVLVERENNRRAEAFVVLRERGLAGLYIQVLIKHSRSRRLQNGDTNIVPTVLRGEIEDPRSAILEVLNQNVLYRALNSYLRALEQIPRSDVSDSKDQYVRGTLENDVL
jgi:hypothetical protein